MANYPEQSGQCALEAGRENKEQQIQQAIQNDYDLDQEAGYEQYDDCYENVWQR